MIFAPAMKLALTAVLFVFPLKEGLASADELMFGGCSAGGLTCYLHCDYVASRMPAAVKTKCICDAMFSANVPHYDGAIGFPAGTRLSPPRPLFSNGAKLDFVCLVAAMPGTCIGGDTSSQRQEHAAPLPFNLLLFEN